MKINAIDSASRGHAYETSTESKTFTTQCVPAVGPHVQLLALTVVAVLALHPQVHSLFFLVIHLHY